MLESRHSRHHRRDPQADILDRLTRIFRNLAAVASGQHSWRVKERSHRARTPAYRGQSYGRRESAGRRAWLVKREISAWRLGIVVCVLLTLIWIAWSIIAQTTALSLARSQPHTALDFVADQDAALNRLVEQELAEPD